MKCVLRDNPTSGPTVLRSELVNDNYCDCLDGSDEPRTAACPGTSFVCKNTGYFTRSIPSAWLSDGHCDCCDGSDEPEGTCVNHCADLMAKALGEANQKADTVRKGLTKRDEYKKLAAEKSVEDDKKVKTLKAQVDVVSKALEKAETRVGKLEELKKLRDNMKKPETPPASDHKQESQDSPDNSEVQRDESSDKTIDEQDDAELSAEYNSADRHDQKSEEGGKDIDDAMDDDGVDDEVDGDYNDIDEDEENYNDHDADSESKDENINDDMDDDDGLGADEDFKDDIDDAEKFDEEDNELGDDGDDEDLEDDHNDEHDINRDDHDHADDVDDNHDDEPDDDYNYERGDEDDDEDYNVRDDEDDTDHDHDITSASSTDDLDMKEYDVDKLCVKLETARGIPIINKVKALGERALKLLIGSKKKGGDSASEGDEASSNVESCLNQARDARNKLERKKSDIERQVERLEQKQGTDYGKLHGDALRMLHGKCTKTKIMQYEFEHCGFDVVRQYEHGHVIANLGKFKGWDGEMTMKYEGGDKCWNGPVRSIKVELVCGAEELVLSVEEPNRCSYFMKFATPAVCHPNLIVDIMKDFTNGSDVNKDEL